MQMTMKIRNACFEQTLSTPTLTDMARQLRATELEHGMLEIVKTEFIYPDGNPIEPGPLWNDLQSEFFRWRRWVRNPPVYWIGGQRCPAAYHTLEAALADKWRLHTDIEDQPVDIRLALRSVVPAGYEENEFCGRAAVDGIGQVWQGQRYPNGEPCTEVIYRGRLVD